MKEVFGIKFETKMTVEAATPKVGEEVAKVVNKVLDKAMPYLERIAEAATKEVERNTNEKENSDDGQKTTG